MNKNSRLGIRMMLLSVIFIFTINEKLHSQLLFGADSISTNWPNMTYFDFSSQSSSNDSTGTNFLADFRGTSNEGLNFGAENTQIPGRRYLRYAINGNLDTVTTVPEWTGLAPWVTVSWDWPNGTSGQPVKVGELWVVYTREGHYACMEITYTDSSNGQPGFGTYFKFRYKYQPNGTRNLTGVIPVELTSFTSQVVVNDVILNWATASETNNAGFNVERKGSSAEWTNVGFITGNGTTSELSNYSYADRNLSNGTYNYRLKQIDLDGSSKYYNLNSEIDINSPNSFELSQNYPNPFNPSTVINFRLEKDEAVTLKIYDISGKEIAQLVNSEMKAGNHSIVFDASSLSSGTYLYELISGNQKAIKKLILIK
ncbi:MAG TPA: hypothetical protein DCY06_00345 [Bacteroidetes bacterium]|nr:hypothetical protein [Bacteroidota bacterium]